MQKIVFHKIIQVSYLMLMSPFPKLI